MEQLVLENAQKAPEYVPPHPLAILAKAVEGGAMDVGVLERLSALAEKWQANQAEQDFGEAIAEFQAAMPPVHKGRSADRFNFAGFDDIMAIAKPILSESGISISFDTDHGDKQIKVTCRLRVGSYHEDKSLTVPVDGELRVTETQRYGAALSYAKRYCLCAALNIVVTDEDDENKLDKLLSEDEMNELSVLLERSNTSPEDLCGKINRTSLADVTSHDMDTWVRPTLKAKIKRLAEASQEPSAQEKAAIDAGY